jgi:hypothetical protein
MCWRRRHKGLANQILTQLPNAWLASANFGTTVAREKFDTAIAVSKQPKLTLGPLAI